MFVVGWFLGVFFGGFLCGLWLCCIRRGTECLAVWAACLVVVFYVLFSLGVLVECFVFGFF